MSSKTTMALAACVALATLFIRGAGAQAYVQRCEVYNSQSNPDYGFGPCVTVRPGDVVIGTPSRPDLHPRRLKDTPR